MSGRSKPAGTHTGDRKAAAGVISGADSYYSDEALQRTAFRAAREARKMEPMLTSFARIAASNPKVSVYFGPGTPVTDGTRIRLRPPVELGRLPEHNRLWCGTRDDNGVQKCPACASLDLIYSSFFHEIAHMIGESFTAVDEEDKAELIARAVHERPSLRDGDRAEKLRVAIDRIEREHGLSYWIMAGAISPFLHPLCNALEDARVNKIMYKARAGTKQMFRAKAFRVFTEGIEQFDGDAMRWDEAPLNSQVIVGLFCLASAYEFDGYFAPEVEDALADPEILRLVRSLDIARSVKAVYRTAFPILERLRELGFCRTDDDIEDDPEPEPEPEPSPDGDEHLDEDGEADPESTDDGESGEPGGDGESDDEESDDGESDDGEPGDGGADADGESDDDSDNDEDAEGSAPGSSDGEPDPDAADDESDDGEPGSGGAWDDIDDDGDPDDSDPGEGGGDAGDDDRTDDEKLADDLMDESGGGEPSDADGDEMGSPGMPGDPDDDESGERQSTINPEDDGSREPPSGSRGEPGGDGSPTGAPEPTDDDPEPEPEPFEADGDADEALKHLEKFGDHEEDDSWDPERNAEEAEMDRALVQEEDFDEPSDTMLGVRTFKHGDGVWGKYGTADWYSEDLDEQMPPSGLITRTLFKARLAFSENKKARRSGGHRSGRVRSNRLATVPTGNDKVFSRVQQPGKRDYFIAVTLDISGSTNGARIQLIRRMGLALGELLDQLGVKFAIYAHTGDTGAGGLIDLYMHEVKGPHDPWGPQQRVACATLSPGYMNLDGHTLEYVRKVCDTRSETNKIILYTSDGSMPAENYDDELHVLKREIEECARRGYLLRGVGVNTDAPTKHGLETVRVDDVSDLPKVIDALAKELEK